MDVYRNKSRNEERNVKTVIIYFVSCLNRKTFIAAKTNKTATLDLQTVLK